MLTNKCGGCGKPEDGDQFDGGLCSYCIERFERDEEDASEMQTAAAVAAGKDVVVDRHIRGTLLKLGFDLRIGEEVKIVVIKKAS